MTTTMTGDAELKRKLSKLKDFSFLVPVMVSMASHVKGAISFPGGYPATGAGNKPSGPGSQWYERGYGPKWMRMDGSINGRNSSENLGKSWGLEAENSGLRQIIGNDTSYGPWVQGVAKVDGAGPQSSAMNAIDWKTTDDVMNEEEEKVLTEIKKAVDKQLASG